MAALLVGMSIMAVLMGAALPVWNKQAQREREEEYLFRANEYARAVMKFRARIANAIPPNFDVLVEQKFLRRKYKDPLTGEDFQPVYMTVAPVGGPGAPTPGGLAPPAPPQPTGTGSQTGQGAPIPGAGVIGVVSKSKGTSIKIYNGRTRYDQWSVTYQDVKPGRGLPPDLLQIVNAAAAAAAGGAAGQQPGGVSPFGTPTAPGGAPGGFGQPNPFGQPIVPTPGQPGTNPFGQPVVQPFGQPGTAPFGQPGTPPFGSGGSVFTPAYPPPAGGTGQPVFAPPPKKSP
jgi:type II secretory pathway pseudopilin PulG